MRHLRFINRRCLSFAFIILIIVLAGAHGFAQSKTSAPERGFNPGNSYAVSNIETISQQSGNLMLNLPVGSLPAGRGGTSAGISLNYNSKIWDLETPEPVAPDYSEFQNLIPGVDGGWNYEYQYRLKSEVTQISPGVCDQRYSIIAPDGSRHLLWLKDQTDVTGAVNVYADGSFDCGATPPGFRSQAYNLTFFTLDGTFMRVEVEGDNDANPDDNRWTLFMPDGSRVVHNPNHSANPQAAGVVQRVFDRNGNSIDFIETASDAGYSNHRTTTLLDQLNRSVVIEYNAATDQDAIHSKGFGGVDLTTKVQWRTVTVNKSYRWCMANCIGGHLNTTTATNFRVVDKIYLPAPNANPTQFGGLAYTFDYNADATTNPSTGWGEVSRVTLPSGAYSTYVYQQNTSVVYVMPQAILDNRATQKTLNYLKENDGGSTMVTDNWTYSGALSGIYSGYCTTTAPDGSASTEYWDSWNGALNPTNSMYNEGFSKTYKTVGADGTTVERVYANNLPAEPSLIASANQFVRYELTSLTDNSGTLSKTAVKEYAQDKNGNPTEIREYDFVPYASSLIQRDGSGRATGVAAGISAYLKRITKTDYYNDVPDAASTVYTDADSYHLASSPRLLHLTKSSEVQNASGTPQTRSEITYDYTNYTTNTKGGNATQTLSWDSFKGGTSRAYTNPLTSINSTAMSVGYDAYGNPTQTTDANGVQSTVTYGSVNGYSDLYPTQTVAASNYTAVKRTSTAAYDFYTGLPTSATDADNNLTSATTYDVLGRPIKVAAAVGTAQEVWTQTDYDDVNRRVVSRSDLYAKGDGKKVAAQFYDQLGRVRLTKSLEDAATQSATNETDGIKVQTRYQTGNPYSYQLTSNPYRATTSAAAGSEPSMGWTQSKSSNTGKHSETETFTGAALPTAFGGGNTNSTGVVKTDSDGDRNLVTDQAGKQRISKSNALGQLTDVWEITASDTATSSVSFPNQTLAAGYWTSYVYDILNNLTTVSQGGQTRSFAYSSLSRLKSATNPESGQINYQYDNNGNLTQKIDARNVQTAYGYDALNRVTLRNYTNEPTGQLTTPNVIYTYDDPGIAHSKGKLTKVTTTGTGTNTFTAVTDYQLFDEVGRVTQSRQTIDGTAYGDPQIYKYNLSGALIEETYPSGRVVKNVLDNDGDLAIVQSKKNGNAGYFNYAKSFTYTAAGAVSSMQLGNGKWESTVFNSRLQPTQIALGGTQNATNLLKLNFAYNTANNNDNNGNVVSQTITTPSETHGTTTYPAFVATQNYNYDSLNRLKSAEETSPTQPGWRQTYLYDRFGNRNFDTGSDANGLKTTTLPLYCATAVCNPAVDPATNKLVGYGFDNAGNTKTDAGGKHFTYDAENHQTEVIQNSVSLGKYYYDGDGKRVEKIALDQATQQLETTIFVYDAGGKLVAEYANPITTTTAQVSYLTSDHLGSPRINTDANGVVISRHDYQPFGEEVARTGYGGDDVRKQFTSYERDDETDLDFAQARYYKSAHGRFTSVDPLMASAKTIRPESWNRYVYCYNNPLSLIDPDGMDVQLLNEKARERVLSTLPEKLRKQVEKQIGKDGLLKKGALDKIKSADANFVDLKSMVNHAKLVEVTTGTAALNGVEFTYTSAEKIKELQIQTAMESGNSKEDTEAEIAEIKAATGTKDAVYDGRVEITESGNIRVTIADGTGKTADEPISRLATTTAHELYAHAYLAQRGKPWENDYDRGPIGARIKLVEQRTMKLYQSSQKPNPSANKPVKRP